MYNQTNRGEMITATSDICKATKKTPRQHYLINLLASHLPKQDSQEQQLAPEDSMVGNHEISVSNGQFWWY